MTEKPRGEYKTILFPTDFSNPSEGARDEAVALARRYGGRLLVLHVVETTASAEVDQELQSFFRTLVKRAERSFDRFLPPPLLEGIAAERLTRTGVPVSEILAVVAERNADLVVIGSHGLSGVARGPFGSVAQKVSLLSPCPVLIVKPRPFTSDIP